MGFYCIKPDSQTTLRVLAAIFPLIFLLVSFLWYGGHKQLIKSLLSHINIPLEISVRFYFMLKEKLHEILCKSMTFIWVLEQEKPNSWRRAKLWSQRTLCQASWLLWNNLKFTWESHRSEYHIRSDIFQQKIIQEEKVFLLINTHTNMNYIILQAHLSSASSFAKT